MYNQRTNTWRPWPRRTVRRWLEQHGKRLPRAQRKRYEGILQGTWPDGDEEQAEQRWPRLLVQAQNNQ